MRYVLDWSNRGDLTGAGAIASHLIVGDGAIAAAPAILFALVRAPIGCGS
jgi:hypothetical protein